MSSTSYGMIVPRHAIPCLESAEAALVISPVVLTKLPRHLQEMRKNAILLVKDSYVEESDFQDDVLAYSLVAQKNTREVVDGSLLKARQAELIASGVGRKDSEKQKLEQPSQLIINGLSCLQKAQEEQDHCHAGRDPSSGCSPSRQPGDDLASQCEELIRDLGVESEHPLKFLESLRCSIPREEDEVDYSFFNTNTLKSEKAPSPDGSENHTASQGRQVPSTGPFLRVLLSWLENMLENTLHVNLLLMGILTQLAAYPQPLLHSFMLNTSMTFQTSMPSLYQVLASIKSQTEHQSSVKQNFQEQVREAQMYLLAKEETLKDQDVRDNGAWLTSRKDRREQGLPSRKTRLLSPQPRNIVFATVLHVEFLKELAAIAQEHSVLSPLPWDE